MQCFSGGDLAAYNGSSFPHTADRTKQVDSADALYIGPSSVRHSGIDVLYRFPLSRVCGGTCSGRINVTIVYDSSAALIVGISDSTKSVSAFALQTQNSSALFAFDFSDHLTPLQSFDALSGHREANVPSYYESNALPPSRNANPAVGVQRKLSMEVGTCMAHAVLQDPYVTSPRGKWNTVNYGLDADASLANVILSTDFWTNSFHIRVLCVTVEPQTYSTPNMTMQSLFGGIGDTRTCGLSLPTGQPTVMPTQPSGMPSAQPTMTPQLLQHNSLISSAVIIYGIAVASLVFVVLLWNTCLADSETSRDKASQSAEHHCLRFCRRVIFRRPLQAKDP